MDQKKIKGERAGPRNSRTLNLPVKQFFLLALSLFGAGAVLAQEDSVQLAPIVVTPTRVEQSSFDLPVSIDAFDKEQIQEGQAQVNLSETLVRAPGVVANTRQNYAQDLQISIRGFGARSTFGVRGIRIVADGIPLTMPDGQGQVSNIDLSTAKSIEVLRGPFSALYGASSGGVIQVFTEDGPEQQTLSGQVAYGSFDTSRLGLKYGGQAGSANYIFDVTRFDTEGYRDHSAATRDTVNSKVKVDLNEGAALTLVINYMNQQETQDPLGLTRSQLAQNPEQAGIANDGRTAQEYNVRKSIEHQQAGLVYENKLTSNDSLRLMGYMGDRQVTQFQSITRGFQLANLATHPGGVIDLDRQFGGFDVRWSHQGSLAERSLTMTVGLNYDRMQERRKGFNNFVGTTLGVLGELRRDENNTVNNFDQYVQVEWQASDRWVLSAGVRHSEVEFESEDFFLSNGNDSGSKSFDDTTPVVGVVFKASPTLNLYANYGKGFETPTFNELAYRADGTLGLNLGLEASESDNYEVGIKSFVGENTRINFAVFQIDTDNEIVVDTSAGGRSTFKNAGKTQRRGAELFIQSDLGAGFSALTALTYLEAEFKEGFTGASTVNAKNKIPGIPQSTAYAEIMWRHPGSGIYTALEGRWSDKVFVNDTNTEFAPSYAVYSWRVGASQNMEGWRVAEFLRVDNLFDKRYVGSVIVNEANGRFYEPAPGINYLVGVSASYQF